MHMKHWMAVLLCAAMSSTVLATEASDIRKTAEASMLVTGWIEVMPDGSVHSYSIDHSEKIPPVVLQLVQNNIPAWKFKVDNHVAVIERARMNVRIVAKQMDDKHDSIGITSAFFGNGSGIGTDYVSYKNVVVPTYPKIALNARVDGTAYLLVRVNRQGVAQDAVAEQVNLGEYGSEHEMQHYRKVLADAALEAVKRWTFNLPTTGPHMSDDHWDIRIPVNFDLHMMGAPQEDMYGKWKGYIPGPRTPIPWLQNPTPSAQGNDAIPAGSISQADEHLHLTTPLDGA